MAFPGKFPRAAEPPAFEFGDFRLEPATRRLLLAGAPVPLAPRAFDLLQELVEHRQRVLDKDELLRRVWSDAVVEESNLTQQVFVLRKALGDSQDKPRFIATIPRRGYRFIAEVRESGPAPAVLTPVIRDADAARRTSSLWPRRTVVVGALGAAILLGAAVFSAALIGRSGPSAPPTFHRLTFHGRGVDRARFTPDGAGVVIAAQWGGSRNQLFFTPAAESALRPLGVDGARVLRVSAGGEAAVLLDDPSGGEASLAKLPLNGGAPRRIVDSVQAADWAPDIDQFALVRRSAGRTRVEYPVGTQVYETAGWIDAIKISPDRRAIAFLEHPVMRDTRGFAAVIERGAKRALSAEWPAVFGLAWLPDGSGIRFGRFDSRVYAITAADLAGHERDIYRGTQGLIPQDIADDGRTLATQFSNEIGIQWLTPGAADARKISVFSVTRASTITADGKTILFTVEDQGPQWTTYATYLQTRDSPGPVRLGEGSAQGLSPDGRWALAILHSTPARLVLLPTGAGQRRDIGCGAIVQFHRAQWLPDGQHVVFAGSEAGKGVRVYTQSLACDGGPTAIAPEGYALDPDGVSADGRFVVCVSDAGQPSRCPVDGAGTIAPLRGVERGEKAVRWSADGRSLYVFRPDRFPLRLFEVDALTGHRAPWKDIAPPDPGSLRSVPQVLMTPDGASYAYNYVRASNYFYVVSGLK